MQDQEAFRRAHAAHMAGDFEAASRGYRALSHYKNVRQNLAVLYKQFGYEAEAEETFRSLGNHDGAHFSLAMLYLGQQRYAEAWPLYEARRRVGNAGIFEPDVPYPEWTGGAIAGKRIMVCIEQGFGDQIMFARYLWPLRERGADVVVATRFHLQRWFEAAGFPTSPFSSNARALPPADFWIFLGSLPLRLEIDEPLPPVRIGPAHRGGGGVGVMAEGSRIYTNDNRSLSPTEAERLLAMGRNLRPEASGARDFQETAEIIAGLDRVITVDTSVAHLAATLGAPTEILLPAMTEWRWLREGDSTPWYPGARLIRQDGGGDWRSVLRAVIG